MCVYDIKYNVKICHYMLFNESLNVKFFVELSYVFV